MARWVVGSEAEALPGQTGSVPTRAVIALQTSADTPAPPPHGAPALTRASPDLGPHGPQERKLTWELPTLLATVGTHLLLRPESRSPVQVLALLCPGLCSAQSHVPLAGAKTRWEGPRLTL